MLHSKQNLSRRGAMQQLAVSASSIALTSRWAFGLGKSGVAADGTRSLKKTRIGLVADVHQDIIHDGYARLTTFVADMAKRKPEAILQLGDFALPRKRNQPFLDVWNSFRGARYHVLGNHDMRDLGFKREQTMEWWGMEKRYYSFDINGWHFVVLDGNDQNPGKWSGYVRYVGEAQRQWLESDLRQTESPTIVFSHQQLESDSGVANSGEIRKILEQRQQRCRTPESARLLLRTPSHRQADRNCRHSIHPHQQHVVQVGRG